MNLSHSQNKFFNFILLLIYLFDYMWLCFIESSIEIMFKGGIFFLFLLSRTLSHLLNLAANKKSISKFSRIVVKISYLVFYILYPSWFSTAFVYNFLLILDKLWVLVKLFHYGSISLLTVVRYSWKFNNCRILFKINPR